MKIHSADIYTYKYFTARNNLISCLNLCCILPILDINSTSASHIEEVSTV